VPSVVWLYGRLHPAGTPMPRAHSRADKSDILMAQVGGSDG